MKSLHNDEGSAFSDIGADAALEKLFSLAVVTHQFMEAGMAARGLSRARATLLWNLNERGSMTQRALAEVLGVSPRNVTGLVDALEADGFVTRGRHPDDRRATLVALTDKGTTTMSGLRGEYDEGATRLFEGLTASDLEGFIATVDQLLVRLGQENC